MDVLIVGSGFFGLTVAERAAAAGKRVIVIGSGDRQVFAPAATQAACLQAGVGFEVMANAAAARTFVVLAGEGRRVVAGFVLARADA